MAGLRSFVVRELREALPATLFFLVLLHLVALTKVALLDDVHWTPMVATGATIGALLVAKAVLVVGALRLPGFARPSNGRRILWKTLLGALVVLAFKVLEELIGNLGGGAGLAGAWRTMLDEVRWPVFGVLSLWIVGGLLLYTLVSELSHAHDTGRLRDFLRRAPID